MPSIPKIRSHTMTAWRIMAAIVLLSSPSSASAQDRLDFLEAGTFSQIGETPRDMLALHGFIKGLGLAGCTWDDGSIQQMAMWVSYILGGMTWPEVILGNGANQYEVQEMLALVRSQGGCQSPRVVQVKTNLIALMQERARPGRIRRQPNGAFLRSTVMKPWPLELQVQTDASTSQQGARELEAAAAAGSQLLECWYQAADGEVVHRVWHDRLPSDVSAGESAALIAPVALRTCPASEWELMDHVNTVASPTRVGIEEMVTLFDRTRHVNPIAQTITTTNGPLFLEKRNALVSDGQRVLECRYVPPRGFIDVNRMGARMQYELEKRSYYWLDSIPRLAQAPGHALDKEYADLLHEFHSIPAVALRACPDVPGIRTFLRIPGSALDSDTTGDRGYARVSGIDRARRYNNRASESRRLTRRFPLRGAGVT
jgi:hypothetical protein